MRPFRLVISDRALEDLADIYEHVAHTDPAAAEGLVGSIAAKFAALAEAGNRAAPRDRIQAGLRAFPFKQRCIYLRVVEDELHVVRVLHGRQGVSPEHFQENADSNGQK